MTNFKEGDEVAWIVKYNKRDTTHAAVDNGVSIRLETSPGNFVLVHNPQLHSASALDVNKTLLEAAKHAQESLLKVAYLKGNVIQVAPRKREIALDAFYSLERAINRAKYTIAAAEKGIKNG